MLPVPTDCLHAARGATTAGGLDASLHYAFDYDLWIRLSRVGPFSAIPVRLARSRMHRENKTLGARKQVFQENIRVLRRHYGYVPVNWVYGYLSFLRDGRDQFFEPLRHSAWVYLASLPVGACYNWRKFGRYWGEWLSRLRAAFPRQGTRGIPGGEWRPLRTAATSGIEDHRLILRRDQGLPHGLPKPGGKQLGFEPRIFVLMKLPGRFFSIQSMLGSSGRK